MLSKTSGLYNKLERFVEIVFESNLVIKVSLWKSSIKKARKSFDLGPFRAPNRARTGVLLIKSQDYITKYKKPAP